MTSTSPDGLTTPDQGDPFNLSTDLAILANDVQETFIRRANTYIGTVAERSAFDAPEGTLWVDTNGDREVWKRVSGSWQLLNPPKFRYVTGTAPVPALNAGSVVYTQRVNYPSGMFTSPPSVSVTVNAVRVNIAISSRTSSYFEFAAANWTNVNQAASVLSYQAIEFL